MIANVCVGEVKQSDWGIWSQRFATFCLDAGDSEVGQWGSSTSQEIATGQATRADDVPSFLHVTQ